MKNIKRIIAVILCVVSLMSVFGINAFAASNTYNPDKAIAYAKKHWNDGKGLCAEFVSDCLREGGFTEVYNVNAKKLAQGLLEHGTKIEAVNWKADVCLEASNFKGTLRKGDIIVWINKSGSRNSGHVALFSGNFDNKDRILVYAHNCAKNNAVLAPSSDAKEVYAIHLNGNQQPSADSGNLPEGKWLCFANERSGKLLNVYGSKNKSNTNVTVYQKDWTSGQDFKLTAHGSMVYNGVTYTKYYITPRCAQSCALNVYGTTSKNGSNVNIWTRSGNSTQDWIFEKVGDGYIIRSANNPIYVLTASGTGNSANVKLATYSAGNTYQIWKLS